MHTMTQPDDENTRRAPSDPDAPNDEPSYSPDEVAAALFSLNPPIDVVRHARRVVRRRIFGDRLVGDMRLVNLLDRWIDREQRRQHARAGVV